MQFLCQVGVDLKSLGPGLARMENQVMQSEGRLAKRLMELDAARMAQWEANKIRARGGTVPLDLARQAGLVGTLGSGPEGHHGGGGVGGGIGASGGRYDQTHGARAEAIVIARELGRGNIGAAVRSTSILLTRLGMLGTIMKLIFNPIGIATLALAGMGTVLYKLGKMSAEIIRGAKLAGVSTDFYQGVTNEVRRSGGDQKQAAAAMDELAEKIGKARANSEELYFMFQKWGISINNANGAAKTQAAIFSEIMAKAQSISDPVLRRAFLGEMFGQGSQEFQKAMENGADFNNPAKAGLNRTNLGVLAEFWAGTKGALSGTWAAIKNLAGGAGAGLLRGAGSLSGGALTQVSLANQRSEDLDRLEQELISKGVIHKVKTAMDPEAQKRVLDIQYNRETAQAAIDDQNKMSLDEMANRTRQLTGAIIPIAHTVTPLMADALRIKQLEAMAGLAYQSKTPEGLARGKTLTSEANAIRESDKPYLKLDEAEPLRAAVKTLDALQGDMDWVGAMLSNYFIQKHVPGNPGRGVTVPTRSSSSGSRATSAPPPPVAPAPSPAASNAPTKSFGDTFSGTYGMGGY
jgi:hypothetical protein